MHITERSPAGLPITFTLSRDLVRRLDAFVERVAGREEGVRFSRSAAARRLLERALCAEESVSK